MRLVVGSTAMRKFVPERSQGDLDLFTNEPVIDPPHRPDVTWYDDFLKYWAGDTDRFATLDELYTIKLSHAYWELPNGSWLKHMSDLVKLKHAGARTLPHLHDLLYTCWEGTFGKKIVSLQQTKRDFFTDAVVRIYDHDSIHYSVAYGDRPMYESVLKDGESIDMDMKKVKALPHEDCVRLFREEVYATALERWIIPNGYHFSPRLAYQLALTKTITSLTKGWSARFLAENYEEFRDPDMRYVEHHKTKRHLLIPLEGQ